MTQQIMVTCRIGCFGRCCSKFSPNTGPVALQLLLLHSFFIQKHEGGISVERVSLYLHLLDLFYRSIPASGDDTGAFEYTWVIEDHVHTIPSTAPP